MENIKYIKNTLQQKGFNEETINYILKYVKMNQKLFGNSLNINKLMERLLNNLKHDITSFDKNDNLLNRFIKTVTYRGLWEPYDGKISINPIFKAISRFLKKERIRNTSTIMHELDHCATTEYLIIDEKQKDEYIQQYSDKNKLTNARLQRFKDRIDKLLQNYNGILAVSGIHDFRKLMTYGIQTRKLNEGITAYKQGIYDEYLGNKSETAYKVEKDVASFISDIIGKDKLIAMHFNNDYDGIRESFNEKTGKDLNDLVKELNKKSYLKTMIFGRLYTRRFSRDIHTYMENIREEHSSKLGERNTDFVPKYQIDHTKAIENMKENGMQKQQMINNEYQQTI